MSRRPAGKLFGQMRPTTVQGVPVKFATSVAMVDPKFYVPLAQAAEDAGFDVVTLSDSVCYPKESESTYPYNPDGTREFLENKPFLEPMVAMAAMATATTTIEFCPFVLKLPLHNPVLYAKQVSSLAVLADDRISLGVGTSPWRDDYQIVGLPWARRSRRFDECVAVIRGLLTGEYFEFSGEFYEFPAIKLNPTPAASVPFLMGGYSDAMMDRAARIGDGWMPAGPMERDLLMSRIARVAQSREECGRQDEPFAIYAAAAPDADAIRDLEELGVTHVMSGFYGSFYPYGLEADTETLSEKVDRLRRFGDQVIAKVRA
jgi:probable F420-dependent oxidoreductase